MWETSVICSSCSGTHRVCATILPRSFSYVCPLTSERVELSYRDPSRTPDPWREVESCSTDAVRVEAAEDHGTLDI